MTEVEEKITEVVVLQGKTIDVLMNLIDRLTTVVAETMDRVEALEALQKR